MSQVPAPERDSPTSERTAPVASRTPPPAPSDTEMLPGRPDLAGAAVFGPLANAGSRARQRMGAVLGPLWARGWGRVVVAAILGVLVVLLATSLAGPSRPAIAEVPDVRGMAYEGAAAMLRRAGLNADKVSFAPADVSQAGMVLETIPGPGEKLEAGTQVHIVAGAITTTPEPASVQSDERGGGDTGEKDRGKGRKKDRDDD